MFPPVRTQPDAAPVPMVRVRTGSPTHRRGGMNERKTALHRRVRRGDHYTRMRPRVSLSPRRCVPMTQINDSESQLAYPNLIPP